MIPIEGLTTSPKVKKKYFDLCTDEQTGVIDNSLSWFNSTTSPYRSLTIKGPAGSGKTTILKAILNNINGSIAVAAPTHKAVKVASKATGRAGVTIQKIMGLRPNYEIEDFDINNIQYDPRGQKQMDLYDILVIDEASMLNKGIITMMYREAIQVGTKILYIGDPYQLQPIKERYSYAFENKNMLELTTIVRQEMGNPLLELLAIVRSDIINGTSKFIRYLYRNPKNVNSNGNGYVCTNNVDHYGAKMVKLFSSNEFSRNVDYARHCGYTNDCISQWNNYVRQQLFNRTNQILVRDDLLTAYKTIVDEYNAPVITNSEDYILQSIMPYKYKAFDITGYLASLRSVDTGIITKSQFIIDHNIKNDLVKFVSIFEDRLRIASSTKGFKRNPAFKEFYDFKNAHLLMVNVKQEEQLICGKDIDYGYGLTIHKTQGSTYDNIFIDLRDILYDDNGVPRGDRNMITRLFYVALSRARKNAYICY